jgi:class 3 adenylate cyclase/predicted ATPase
LRIPENPYATLDTLASQADDARSPIVGAIMDIVGWLRSLGLEEYEAAFRDNKINERVLPSLTQEDLKEIGVGPVGHRRILLEAIAALRADAAGKAPSADAATTSATPSVSPEDRAERRQVTVMFADLVGSTALSARMDPEDLREVISAYRKCAAETVQRFSGFVAKFLGDGVLIYFGYPQAQEDDAERAVRAGLELVAAVSDLKTHATLRTRVGIATGLVVVGDLIGSGASQEQAIVGETPNLAARLQGVAEPNSVVIAESTRKLVGNLFELEDLGAQDLKGISGPTRAWAALRPSSVEGRFEALHPSGVSELVGREEEFDLLLRRWAKAKTGEGQVVLLSGEAGIGKSRLAVALLERVASEPHTRLRYFCSPQRTDSALFPIISQMERAAGFTHEDTARAKLDKLDALLARSLTPRQDAALLAEMLSLSNDGRYPTLELTPQQRRQRTLEALSAQVAALAQQTPVLMIFEDVHWIDPTSLEVLGRGISRNQDLGALLLITFRPEFDAPWIGQPHVTSLTLNRLTQREIATLVDRVTGNSLLPESIKQDIIERTDGIPLFVEEMTKALLEGGEPAIAIVPTPLALVPASLHASLMARLDRLGSAKEALQIGAAIGRDFSYSLLAAVARISEAELQWALDRSMAAGLLFRQGTPPNASYLFNHALVQDAAYGTLLREPRRTLHARIAETLESEFAEIADNQPELLARHCTEAGLIEKAAGLWGKAGERSLARSALVEANEQIKRALDHLATMPITAALRREQIKLQVALLTPLMHLKGHAASETKAAIDRAQQLIEQSEALGEPLEDPLLLFSVLYGLWAANLVAFNGGALCDLASQFLSLAAEREDLALLMIGRRLMAVSLANAGRTTEAISHYNRAVELYDPAEHRPLTMRFGQDGRVSALGYRSLSQWVLGYPEAAVADATAAVKEAREIGQAATLMFALTLSAITLIYVGEYPSATGLLDELIELTTSKNVSYWKGHGANLKGTILVFTNTPPDAVDAMSSGLAMFRSTGSTLLMPLYVSNLGMAHGKLGKFEDAVHAISDAIDMVETTNQRWLEAEVYRTGGEVQLLLPEPNLARAETYFDWAITVAPQQQAKSWELRAAMSMARLWRSQGKVQQARELLAPVYGWFTEGFDTRDLKEAKELLQELAA